MLTETRRLQYRILKNPELVLERFEYQWQQMLEFPGQRRFHENWGRRLLSRDPSMLQFVEGVYEELESQAA